MINGKSNGITMKSLKGHLLISSPEIPDDDFAETVILLVEHADDGAYIVASVGWFAWMLWQYPTLERAIGKNGSISAYAYCAANLGLYASALLFLVGGTSIWMWRCLLRRRGQQGN